MGRSGRPARASPRHALAASKAAAARCGSCCLPVLTRLASNLLAGFNVETVEYKNISFTVWDVGGQDKASVAALVGGSPARQPRFLDHIWFQIQQPALGGSQELQGS